MKRLFWCCVGLFVACQAAPEVSATDPPAKTPAFHVVPPVVPPPGAAQLPYPTPPMYAPAPPVYRGGYGCSGGTAAASVRVRVRGRAVFRGRLFGRGCGG